MKATKPIILAALEVAMQNPKFQERLATVLQNMDESYLEQLLLGCPRECLSSDADILSAFEKLDKIIGQETSASIIKKETGTCCGVKMFTICMNAGGEKKFVSATIKSLEDNGIVFKYD